MPTNAEVQLGNLDNEAQQWLLGVNQKKMPRRPRRSTEHFNLCWRSTRAKLIAFQNKYQKKSVDLYPRQQFVREQAQLLVGDYVEKLDSRKFTAARFREGVENLYYLLEATRAKDHLAQTTLNLALSDIVLACGDLVEYYENAESLSITDWKLVSVLFKQRVNATSPRPRIGRLRDFKLGHMIGVGGFGVVYKAKLGKIPCVLKFVPPNVLPSSDQALVDKEVACMINHPCLVEYYATLMIQDAFITCMEFIDGVALVRMVHKSPGGLPSNLVRLLIAQVGLAVQHLHFKGFIHRDIKPDNIMVTPGCRIKLIDFDTCRVCAGKYTSSAMPTFQEKTAKEFPGADLAGTVPYMAPEALMKTGLGRASDWWSVGVTTYHMSTGRLPFHGYSVEEVQYQAVVPSYSWPYIKRWSTDLTRFVADLMNPDPYSRLCSEHYSQFQLHRFFKGLDFHWLETEAHLGDFPLIDQLMERHPATDSRNLSEGAHNRRKRLFPTLSFAESPNPKNCYYYSSPGFISCLRVIDNGRTPTLKDIEASPENLDVYDDESAPYVFENFLKDSEEEPEEWRNRGSLRTGARNRNATYYKQQRVHRQVTKYSRYRE